ncbi:helix-turn-helix transcriptional regulator [Parapedobacter sp. 2B3]|uniref:helix-turn-helix transcriptional regulator n=1 Tax=Parapedobacter sp. 2B3 TaxID=3342381 RepID=UPI0035B69A3D
METLATLKLLLEETKKIRDLLAERIPRHGQRSPAPQLATEPPEHVDITWVTEYLGISKGTFYNEVNGKLLKPIITVGRRPYYLKSDVMRLMTEREKKHLGFRKLNIEQKNRANK